MSPGRKTSIKKWSLGSSQGFSVHNPGQAVGGEVPLRWKKCPGAPRAWDAHGGARPAQPCLPCSPGKHWAAVRGKRALKSVEDSMLLLSLDQNQAGHGGSSVIHLSGGTERLARTQPCSGCWGLAELPASISPSCKMKTNACQPSALRDLINECLSSDLSRDPFNERFHKQCKASFSWQ